LSATRVCRQLLDILRNGYANATDHHGRASIALTELETASFHAMQIGRRAGGRTTRCKRMQLSSDFACRQPRGGVMIADAAFPRI
jgi:hypothetical protein